MAEITGFRMMPMLSKVIDRPLQVGRIPQNDGSHQQVQAARAATLILIGSVANFTDSIEEDGAAKRILLLAFAESDVA